MNDEQNCHVGRVRPAPGRGDDPLGLVGLVGKASNLDVLEHLLCSRREQYERRRLVRALKQVHRKHVQGEASIGWNELEREVSDALASVMGERQFQRWLEGERHHA
jgi:hypothetical protein